MLDRRYDSISSDWVLKQHFHTRRVKPRATEVFLILLVMVFLALFWDRLPVPWRASATAQTAAHSTIRVWVNKGPGLYYCPNSKLYGTLKPGFFMPQGKALEAGYRPRLKETCQ